MMPSQIILSMIIISLIIKTAHNNKRYKLNRYFTLLWILFWIIILYFIFNGEILSYIANQLGIGRGVDFAVYLSIILVLYLNYILFLKIDELKKSITKITRHIALQQNDKK